MKRKAFLPFYILTFLSSLSLSAKLPIITVSSKVFTESYVLAEILSQIIEDQGEATVDRKFGLGGTGLVFGALKNGDIDLYPEYTGTIKEAILKYSSNLSETEIRERVERKYNLSFSKSLGFNNTYGLAVVKDRMSTKSLRKISDIGSRDSFKDLKVVFGHEFMKRSDGLKALENHYNLTFHNPVTMEHSLAYEALKNKKVDLAEIYTTDAKIKRYDLRVLEDDKRFFPNYLAVLFHKKDFPEKYPKTWKAIKEKMIGKISEKSMVELNSLVEIEGMSFSQAAAIFLGKKRIPTSSIPLKKIGILTKQHIKLVLISLFLSIIFGIPLGIMAAKNKLLAQISLVGTGLLQTIPSLALLCFLIPLFGIGERPAYIALFLYGLLPIVRNTFIGIKQITSSVDEAADLIGLTKSEKLRLIQLPLASVSILAGIKTSAIINVGTATLAAFIGAGGLGNLIVTGLSLNDNQIILSGAIPAALLATFFHFIFELIDKIIIPKGIR